MTDNQFDNFFREKLKDHTAPVLDGLWERIRPEKDKRPKGFYLPKINGTRLMVAALLVGCVIIGLLTYQSKQSVPFTESSSHQTPTSTNTTNHSNLKDNQTTNNSTLNSTSHNSILLPDSVLKITDETSEATIKLIRYSLA